MKRLLLISAGVLAAGGVAVAPAIAGLNHNPSFSHQIPIRVPSQAHVPHLVDDHGRDVGTPTPGTGRSSSTEPGDDRGGVRHPEPGDDREGVTRRAEPSDDRSNPSRRGESGDDHGGSTTSTEPGDDRGGRSGGGSSGGSGSDDNGAHGGRGDG